MRIVGIILLIALLCPGCASIVSKSKWPFSVQTEPSGALVEITNRRGQTVFTGRTPTALTLKSGAGYFRKEKYLVSIRLDGFPDRTIPVTAKVNGWYFGNALFGGLLGFLIIDPLTGAMYKLDQDGISLNLNDDKDEASLKILDRRQIPASWEKHLVRIDTELTSQ